MTGELQHELAIEKQWVLDKYWQPLEHPLKDAVRTLLLTSDYAGVRHGALLDLLQDKELRPRTRQEYFELLRHIPLASSQVFFMKALREYRHRELMRLLILQYAGRIQTDEAILAWSHVADALILYVMAFCQHQLEVRYGKPRTSTGSEAQLYVLAMGKLGGLELNFSSDIDLIFSYEEAGDTDGDEVISNQHFFSKVIQHFVAVMQTVTADGFVFRVDLRLRPNGDSGALVLSLTGMETYYQEQGRDWERYAMVKARVISENLEQQPAWFARLITPFVYRRYIDFSVLESLRAMKAMIEREVLLHPGLNDLKRGKGGIREVEFIIQNIQLIRGGRLQPLQKQSILEVLEVCKEHHLLADVEALKQAYLFLRRLENVVQMLHDQQTHALPEDPLKQKQVALAMGYASYAKLISALQRHQNNISELFKQTLAKPDDFEDDKHLLANQLMSLWQGHAEEHMAINLLSSLGFANPQHANQMLATFRQSPRCKRLTQASRLRLDRFMLILLTEMNHKPHNDEMLLQILRLLEHLVGRSAYLALLAENPKALHEVLYCLQHSPYITNLLVNHPFLLECLLDTEAPWHPISKAHLSHQLQAELMGNSEPEEVLRQFKLKQCLMAARAVLLETISSLQMACFLADVAEVILHEVVLLACGQLSAKHPEILELQGRFVVLAYGTFGSRAMNVSSDLDLVFLHAAKSHEDLLVTRLTQKILTLLTVRSQSGILYAVDTRLRPSGSAGLLVSSFKAFKTYQLEQAWTWEHQALLKARVVVGSSSMKRQLTLLKAEVIKGARHRNQLQDEVLVMRAKIEAHLEPDPVKKEQGGLLDLEFLVQYLILKSENPVFASKTSTKEQIRKLEQLGVLKQKQASILQNALSAYLQSLQHAAILGSRPELEPIQAQVRAIYDRIFNQNSAYKS